MPTSLRILAICVLIFLALTDLKKNGRRATRWREYTFLLLCVAVAVLYGIANDQITSRISWEYFYYGKELSPILGPDVPPNPAALHWQAARIVAAATWWTGLIAGVAILFANNPSPRRPQLPYSRLAACLPMIVFITAIFASIFGIAGNHDLLNSISPDFRDMAALNLWHPHHFMTAYGIHLGGYMGGVMATIYGVWSIISERRRRNNHVSPC